MSGIDEMGHKVTKLDGDDSPDRTVNMDVPAETEWSGSEPDVVEDGDMEVASTSADGQPFRVSRVLKVLSDPTGVQSSAVGALRNHLTQQHLSLGRRSLAICSVSNDVNRSYVSASLAIAAAQSGASTVLIDANLREPELETYFRSDMEKPGLSELLSGQVDSMQSVVSSDILPNLSLVHAGKPPTDPQSLLSGKRFEEFIAAMMRSYDFTIVDCPSARHSSDARRISSVVRYALIVTKQDVTYVADVKNLISELNADRVNVVGTFLNVD